MLQMRVDLETGSFPQILEQMKAAGQSPVIVGSRKLSPDAVQVTVRFARINEVAASALVQWMRRVPGVKRAYLE
jgi:hypothetical protein